MYDKMRHIVTYIESCCKFVSVYLRIGIIQTHISRVLNAHLETFDLLEDELVGV